MSYTYGQIKYIITFVSIKYTYTIWQKYWIEILESQQG